MQMSLLIAIALSTAGIHLFGISSLRNKWLCLLVPYVLLSAYMATPATINILGKDLDFFWTWPAYLKLVIFSLFFFVVASYKFTKEEIARVIDCMIWCGALASVYNILQFACIEQFFVVKADGHWGRIGGFLSNPTWAAPFSAMILPLAVWRKRWLMALACLLGAIVPDSQMTWGALVFGGLVWLALKGRKYALGAITAILLATAAFGVLYTQNKAFNSKFNDHERVYQWKHIVKDALYGRINPADKTSPRSPVTGRGIGSFWFLYHSQNPDVGKPNSYKQAHNDFIETLYWGGIVGLWLMLMTILDIFKTYFKFYEDYKKPIIISISMMLFNCAGAFLMQIGPFCIWFAVLCGLIYANTDKSGFKHPSLRDRILSVITKVESFTARIKSWRLMQTNLR